MSVGLWVFIAFMSVVAVYVLMAAKLLPKKVQNGAAGPTTGEGGLMNTIARWVVLGLGHVTFGALHLFKKLGVDVATLDETLAAWTSWSQDIKQRLADALADAQNLRDTDAAEDAVEANALSEALAKKVQDAFDAATAVPTIPGTTDPVEEPVVVDDTPAVPAPDEPTVPPTPFDPATPAEDATPVAEAEESVATDERTAE